MRKRSCLRVISGFLSILLFCHNCVLAHAAETNFWAERSPFAKATGDKSSFAKTAGDKSSFASGLQLVGLPPVALAKGGNQLPKVIPNVLSQELFKELKNIPGNYQSKFSSLLQSIPSNYGTIRKISIPKGAKNQRTIIHIQDVHLNTEAQENIGKTIQALILSKQADLIALEGAFSPLDLAPFRQFPHQDTVHKVADYLLKENKISGPVYTAFTSGPEIPPFIGIDDSEHYHANVDAYRRSSVLVKGLKKKLLERENDLIQEKNISFNASLKTLDSQVQAYREGKFNWGNIPSFLPKTIWMFHRN